MTPDEIRAARKNLGLSQHGLAEALRMGTWGWQSVAKWEAGKKRIGSIHEARLRALLVGCK